MSAPKKILIFVDWYLPGFKAGGPIQSCANLVAHLGVEHDFYVVTRNTDYCSDQPYTSVESDTWQKAHGGTCYYISRKNLGYRALKSLYKEVEPDIVYINGIYSLYFSILPLILARQLKYERLIVAGRGMLAASAVNVKSIKKRFFFHAARFTRLYHGVIFHATNEQERSDIQALLGADTKVMVAPNLPAKQTCLPENVRRVKTKGELRLVSVARISPEKNTYFALELLTKYKGKNKIVFDIFGPVYDEAYWEKCISLIKDMPSNVQVNYFGSLKKEEVGHKLTNYHALFLPTRGENFGHVILESMMAGCGIIISDQTPWRELQIKGIGYDIPLSDTAAFLEAIDELASLDQERFDRLSGRAFSFARSYTENEEHLNANRELFR